MNIRKLLLIGIIMVSAFGCNNKPAGSASQILLIDTARITFNKATLTIDLQYPIFNGCPLADSLNKAVTETLKTGLCANPASDSLNMTKFVAAFIASKDSLDRELNHDIPYQLLSEWDFNENKGVASLFISRYVYTGGANGIQTNTFLNFNARTGERLSTSDIFADTTMLKTTNREFFRRFMASNHKMEDTMYLFVPIDSLPLPRNIGFDSVGAVMIYDQYEIAARVFGVSRYTIPYKNIELKSLIP